MVLKHIMWCCISQTHRVLKHIMIWNVTFYHHSALSNKVDTVKEENLKLKAENQVLGQYIESLMAASSMFSSAEG